MAKRKKKQEGIVLGEGVVAHGVLSNLDKFVDVGAFMGLYYAYHIMELGDFKMAFPQAAIDFLLLKSGTEVGVSAALGHMGVRALIEGLEKAGAWFASVKDAMAAAREDRIKDLQEKAQKVGVTPQEYIMGKVKGLKRMLP